MSSNQYVEADQFAVALNSIFSGIEATLSTDLEQPVRKACKKARVVAQDSGKYKDRTGGYRSGFQSRVDRQGKYEAIGYVGNKKKPGLVHLLEKGHATMRGGRTRAFVHMKTGAEAGEKVLIEEAGKLVDKALKWAARLYSSASRACQSAMARPCRALTWRFQ